MDSADFFTFRMYDYPRLHPFQYTTIIFKGPAPPGAGMPRGPGGPPGPGGPGSPLPGPGGPTPHGGFVPGPQYSRMPGTFVLDQITAKIIHH